MPYPKERILIVDDDPRNLMSLKAALEITGADIFTVQSGQAALQFLMKSKVSLILLDVQMPDMNGYETATLIHQHREHAQVPLIFITANYKTEWIYLKLNPGNLSCSVFIPILCRLCTMQSLKSAV